MMRGRKMGFVLAVGGLGLAVARDMVAAGENMACAPGLYEGIAEQVEAVHQLSLQGREEIMTNVLAEDSLVAAWGLGRHDVVAGGVVSE